MRQYEPLLPTVAMRTRALVRHVSLQQTTCAYIYIYIFKCIWILHNSTTLYKETVTTAIKTTILTNNFTIATRWSVNSCIVAAALKRQHSLAVSCCKSMAVNSSQPPILILFFFLHRSSSLGRNACFLWPYVYSSYVIAIVGCCWQNKSGIR